jgi:hypothetical protein
MVGLCQLGLQALCMQARGATHVTSTSLPQRALCYVRQEQRAHQLKTGARPSVTKLHAGPSLSGIVAQELLPLKTLLATSRAVAKKLSEAYVFWGPLCLGQEYGDGPAPHRRHQQPACLRTAPSAFSMGPKSRCVRTSISWTETCRWGG